MPFVLVRRRTLPVPTLWGWLILAAFFLGVAALWLFEAESFLSLTQREPADTLVVEAWIGFDGLSAARDEFVHGHYRYLVAAGGPSESPWDSRRWNYADEAHDFFIRQGLPADDVITARQGETRVQRTHATAVAAREALAARGLHPSAINVFTAGPHARRSRLIFAKVFRPGTKVGVVSWVPARRAEGPWWRSSIRSEDLVKETVGYLFELLFSSGRWLGPSETQPR
ncbi:MAG TPA: ElyC/SanA/YdcF family protein [Candidatus Didemnitutus sp.]|jgi:uncharacterized SAM-binding protein YcdF (DUF218 family)